MRIPHAIVFKPWNIDKFNESKCYCSLDTHDINAKAFDLNYFWFDEGIEHFSLARGSFFVFIVLQAKIKLIYS